MNLIPDVKEKILEYEQTEKYKEDSKKVKDLLKNEFDGRAKKGKLVLLAIIAIICLMPIMSEKTFMAIFIGIIVIWIVGIALYIKKCKNLEELGGFMSESEKEQYELIVDPLIKIALPNEKYNIKGSSLGKDCNFVLPINEEANTYSDNIVFNDLYKTEYSNCCCEAELEKRNNRSYIIFRGGIMKAQMRHGFNGTLYICPSNNKNKSYINDKTKKYEVGIDNYDVYTSNQVEAKMLLNSDVISVLEKWSGKIDIKIYISFETLYISFNSGRCIFSEPENYDEIENYSMLNIYNNLFFQINNMYEIVEKIASY